MSELPTYYIPHGGGPWPFMPERAAEVPTLAAFLHGLLFDAGARPRAILVISGHWEEPVPTVSSRSDYSMLYDYTGFPEHTYGIQYPAPGSPEVAAEVVAALQAAGFPVAIEQQRGYDHGVFVPLMLVDPEASIPVIPLSLVRGLDPERHLAIGRALRALRSQNILIVGSGMSFHNLRALYGGTDVLARSAEFDTWLNDVLTGDPAQRDAQLDAWATAPQARFAHPREEHFVPLMVAAGAADGDAGSRVYHDVIMGAMTSGFRFG